MSTDRGMGKEVVVHIQSGTLLSHEKEYIWVSISKVDNHSGVITHLEPDILEFESSGP